MMGDILFLPLIQAKPPAMKKLFFASVFLSSIAKAATGSRSGEDYIVLLAPVLLITIIWGGYQFKNWMKARKERELNASKETDTAEDTPAV
jgi:hypothetical protein